MECLHQLLKSKHLIGCSISLNPYNYYGISNLESWKKKRKRKAILLLAYIADVSCITNRSFFYANIQISMFGKMYIEKFSLLLVLNLGCHLKIGRYLKGQTNLRCLPKGGGGGGEGGFRTNKRENFSMYSLPGQ